MEKKNKPDVDVPIAECKPISDTSHASSSTFIQQTPQDTTKLNDDAIFKVPGPRPYRKPRTNKPKIQKPTYTPQFLRKPHFPRRPELLPRKSRAPVLPKTYVKTGTLPQKHRTEIVSQKPRTETSSHKPRIETLSQRPRNETFLQKPRNETITQKPRNEILPQKSRPGTLPQKQPRTETLSQKPQAAMLPQNARTGMLPHKPQTGTLPQKSRTEMLPQKPQAGTLQQKPQLQKPPIKISKEQMLYNSLLSDIDICTRPLIITTKGTRKTKKKPKICYTNVRLKHMDPLILHGISLHRYANNMCEMIRVAELAIESNLIPPADAAPPLPKVFKSKPKHVTNSLNYMPKTLTRFSLGIEEPPPELSSQVVREILYQSVAAITGLLGFETTHQSVLDVLVDVLTEFLKKVTYRLKLAFEDSQRGWLLDFPNIAERVLVELGMGGCTALHDYYQSRVIQYVKLLEKNCEDLNKHYVNLITNKSPATEDPKFGATAIKMEIEDEVVEIDTPQVQIAINEELELPSLDAGFQLLSSLEAGS